MTDDDARAAAARLLDNTYRLGIDDQRAQDIEVVASYALEAGQEVARCRDELHVYHTREELRLSNTTSEMDDCPRCMALSTPGEQPPED